MEEDTRVELKYPTQDATYGNFSFGSSGFHINSLHRESGRSLRRILFPEFLKSKKARDIAKRNASSSVNLHWIKAQLQFYGIDFTVNIDPFKAKALLLTSIAHGLVSISSARSTTVVSTITELSLVRYNSASNCSDRGHTQRRV